MSAGRDGTTPPAAAARRPKVLQVGKFYPPHMGGIETHLANLCAALSEAVELEVVVAADGPATVEETVDGVAVARLGTRATLAGAPLTPGLARRIRRSGADLVHVHLPHPGAMLSVLASRFRGPVVATWHSDVVRQRLLGAAFAPAAEAFLARADALVATSPDYAATSPALGRHRAKVRVLPYGIPAADFAAADPAAVAELRRRHGERLVLAVGRLIYYKGFEVLVEALARLDGARVLLAGDGPLRGELEALAARRGVADRVVFLGNVDNRRLAPYYHAADVFCLPSVARSEAFGIVQLEAMAAGTPVVNTALDSGVPFVSRHGESGLTVPPGDPEALAAALAELLDDPERARRLGEAGRRRVAAEFTVEVMAARVLALYRELLGAAG
jgi:rhamnosyl/mannosyltransferase